MAGRKRYGCFCCFAKDSYDSEKGSPNSGKSERNIDLSKQNNFSQDYKAHNSTDLGKSLKSKENAFGISNLFNEQHEEIPQSTGSQIKSQNYILRKNQNQVNEELRLSLESEQPNRDGSTFKLKEAQNKDVEQQKNGCIQQAKPYTINLSQNQNSDDSSNDFKIGQSNNYSTTDLYKQDQDQVQNSFLTRKQEESTSSDLEKLRTQSSEPSIAQSLGAYLDQEDPQKIDYGDLDNYNAGRQNNTNGLHSVEFPKLQDDEKQKQLVEQYPKSRNKHLNLWILKHVQAEEAGLTSEQLKTNLQYLQQKNKLQMTEEENDQDCSVKNQLSFRRGFNSSRTSFSVASWDSGSLATVNQSYKRNQIQSSKKVVPKLTNSISVELENDKQIQNENPTEIYSNKSSAHNNQLQRLQSRSRSQSLSSNISRRRRVRRLIDDMQFENNQNHEQPDSYNVTQQYENGRLFNSDQIGIGLHNSIDTQQRARILEVPDQKFGMHPIIEQVSSHKHSKSKNLNSSNLQDSISFDSQQLNNICFNDDTNQQTQNDRLRPSSPGLSFNKQPLFQPGVVV